MNKSSVVHARVDTELKENVENILAAVGLTPTDAINLMFKQIELNNGLPFEIKVPDRVLAERRLMAGLNEGKDSVKKNGWIDPAIIRTKYGV